MNTTIPELLAPAGSFAAALAAFDGGADAVYLGLPEFSARRQARNLDRDEFLRLRRASLDAGKRVYVAMNTLVLERELPAAMEALAFLAVNRADAVIMQDLGLMTLAREKFPGLRVHASTQTAAQNDDAFRALEALGAKRVVLPRETGFATMGRHVASNPGIEFEAFVHGALCYSFSGLCLASGRVAGRSGNRGDCAQPCRSRYDLDGRGRGSFFSCGDLDLSAHVEVLVATGVASLKIEGRMKAPEYVFAVSRLYRRLIDAAREGTRLDERDRIELLDEARVAFARTPTTGYAFSESGDGLIDSAYPGHRGVSCGSVVRSGAGKLTIRLSRALRERDGLLVFGRGDRAEPTAFSARDLRDPRSGSTVRQAGAGALVDVAFDGVAAAGSPVSKISSRDQDRSEPNPAAWKPFVFRVPCRLRGVGAPGAALELDFVLPDGTTTRTSVPLLLEEPVARAKEAGGFLKAARLFSERGDAPFELELIEMDTSTATIADGESISLADAFVPPSVLKKAKNAAYETASAAWRKALDTFIARALPPAPSIGAGTVASSVTAPRMAKAPSRSALVYATAGVDFPFATRSALDGDIAAHPDIDGMLYVPLSPLCSDTVAYETALRAFLERARRERPETAVMLGINALHHAGLVARLRSDGFRVGAFADVYAYVANARAYAAWDELAGGISYAYFFVEARTLADVPPDAFNETNTALCALAAEKNGDPRGTELARIAMVDEAFSPPLFASKGCFREHDDAPCADCGTPRRRPTWTRALAGGKRRYVVLVDDCVTWLFETPS